MEGNIQQEYEKYNKLLAAEGMPEELSSEIEKLLSANPEWAEMIESADSEEQAIKRYVRSRRFEANIGSLQGEHYKYAMIVKNKFKSSKSIQEISDIISEELERL